MMSCLWTPDNLRLMLICFVKFDFMTTDNGEDDRCNEAAQLSRDNNCDWDLIAWCVHVQPDVWSIPEPRQAKSQKSIHH